MRFRLEKLNHIRRQKRFYELGIVKTLFGEWCLEREWGRIGSGGGQRMYQYFGSRVEAEKALQRLKAVKSRRGYATIPVQLILL